MKKIVIKKWFIRKSVVKKPAALVLAGLLMLLSCCAQGGIELPFILPPCTKLSLDGAVVRALCYVDVKKYNPLNALDYTLEGGTPLFDYVVLGAAELKKSGQWVYVDVPPELRNMLERRYTYITPFQQRGTKVLLGLTGGQDGVSFGTITKDDQDELARCVQDIVVQYSLDGVEIYDANGANSADPQTFPYPEGWYTPTLPDGSNGTPVWVERYSDPGEKQYAWEMGGDTMNNFIWRLRVRLGDHGTFPIIIREENHGKYLPYNVTGTDFTGRDDQLNYTMNPCFESFGSPDNNGESSNELLYHSHYGPLAINLEGDRAKGTVVPPLEVPADSGDGDIFAYSEKYADAKDYALIFCSNLKPASAAASESFLDVPPAVMPQLGNKTHLSQAEYLSIVTQKVFGKNVVCVGGDRR